MERFEDRYALLKVAYSDMEFAVTRSFLEANGIKVTSQYFYGNLHHGQY